MHRLHPNVDHRAHFFVGSTQPYNGNSPIDFSWWVTVLRSTTSPASRSQIAQLARASKGCRGIECDGVGRFAPGHQHSMEDRRFLGDFKSASTVEQGLLARGVKSVTVPLACRAS